MFNGFTKEALRLLKSFEENNKKEFFETKREDYNKYILEPNRAFVQEMGEHLILLHPNIQAIPKVNKSLFKIFRDSRFHLNEPLKSRIGIIFWAGNGHRMQSSSFYMHYNHNSTFWAAGVRNFKPPLLKSYREYIQDKSRRDQLHKILKLLNKKGYLTPEPKYKRVPAECNSSDENAYLYKMGAIYAYKENSIEAEFFNSKIVNISFSYYKDMLPLFEWVENLTIYAKSKNV